MVSIDSRGVRVHETTALDARRVGTDTALRDIEVEFDGSRRGLVGEIEGISFREFLRDLAVLD